MLFWSQAGTSYLFVSYVGGLGDRFFSIGWNTIRRVLVLCGDEVRWKTGGRRGVCQPSHSQAFCLSKAGFLGWKSEKRNFGYTAVAEAGLYRSSRFCCGSRHFARQRWITEPLQQKAQPRTLTQIGTLPSAFVGCKVCESLGRAANFPELFWSSSLSKENFRKEQMPARSAQNSIPWKKVCEQLYSYEARLDLAKTSSDNEVADGWTTAPEVLLSAPLGLGTLESCEEGKAAEMLCWTTCTHSAKTFQQFLLWASAYSSIRKLTFLPGQCFAPSPIKAEAAYPTRLRLSRVIKHTVVSSLNPFWGNSVTVLSYLLEDKEHTHLLHLVGTEQTCVPFRAGGPSEPICFTPESQRGTRSWMRSPCRFYSYTGISSQVEAETHLPKTALITCNFPFKYTEIDVMFQNKVQFFPQ